jgi:hypothetical protein
MRSFKKLTSLFASWQPSSIRANALFDNYQ